MSEQVTYVALLGPVGSGKTALIPSLQKSASHTHGLRHDIDITVAEDTQAFQTEAGTGTQPGRADQIRKLKLADASRYAFRGDQFEQPSTLDQVNQYPMRLRCRRGGVEISRKVSVLDSGGGLMLPSDRAKRERERNASNQGGLVEQRIKALQDLLIKDVRGIVFCIDITWENTQAWEDAFRELLDNIVRNFEVAPGQPRRRIALTFTKTDQLFMLDGMKAARNALTRQRLMERLQATFRSATRDILAEWRKLEGEQASRIEIRCFPTSVFGYIRDNGCVNYSLSKDTWLVGDDSLRDALGQDAGEEAGDSTSLAARFWRPMLTIDPFIYAAFGDDRGLGVPLASHYMFELDEFLGARDPEDAGPQGQERRWGPFRWRTG